MRRTSLLRLLLLLALLAAFTVAWVTLPVKQWVGDFTDWARGQNRYWGLTLFALSYTPATLTFFPASLLTLAAGALYGDSLVGVLEATLFISPGSVLAASTAFFVGRKLARGWVEQKVAGSPRFQALDRAVGENGFKIVLLTRLSPIFPFNLLNYVYGLTKVSFRDYLLASWVGMLPGTVLYLWLGRTAKGLAELVAAVSRGEVRENLGQLTITVVGLAATVAVSVVLARVARKSLHQKLGGSNSGEQSHERSSPPAAG